MVWRQDEKMTTCSPYWPWSCEIIEESWNFETNWLAWQVGDSFQELIVNSNTHPLSTMETSLSSSQFQLGSGQSSQNELHTRLTCLSPSIPLVFLLVLKNAPSIEESLKNILSMIPRWDAVLLDEAEVFMEARSTDNLERNGLVSIFLRVFEHYEVCSQKP